MAGECGKACSLLLLLLLLPFPPTGHPSASLLLGPKGRQERVERRRGRKKGELELAEGEGGRGKGLSHAYPLDSSFQSVHVCYATPPQFRAPSFSKIPRPKKGFVPLLLRAGAGEESGRPIGRKFRRGCDRGRNGSMGDDNPRHDFPSIRDPFPREAGGRVFFPPPPPPPPP